MKGTVQDMILRGIKIRFKKKLRKATNKFVGSNMLYKTILKWWWITGDDIRDVIFKLFLFL